MSIGIKHQGSGVISIGLLPTPALSICMNMPGLSQGLYAGIQITASHNPFHDNGVKFFDKNGFKLGNDLEEKIENNYFNWKEEININNQQNSKSNSSEDFNKYYINYLNNYFSLKMKDVKIPK